MNRFIAAGDYKFLNRVFSQVPVHTASRHILLALARTTFPVRTKLSGWKPFVDQIRLAFDNRSLDSARLLKGLID